MMTEKKRNVGLPHESAKRYAALLGMYGNI